MNYRIDYYEGDGKNPIGGADISNKKIAIGLIETLLSGEGRYSQITIKVEK